MKTSIAICAALLSVWIQSSPALADTRMNGASGAAHAAPRAVSTTMKFEIKGRKGSKRVGGTNSKGKRSRYVGGRK
jgi:hypothetical protein